MKISVSKTRLRRGLLFVAAGLVSPLLLTQCKSTGGSYKDIEYDPTTLKTPSGHGMEKKDYPFDDDGRYRKEWVKNKSTGKTRSASKLPEPEMASLDTTGAGTSPPAAPAGFYGPADASTIDAPSAAEVAAVTAPAPAVAEASYHKVVSGDTLYSLSRRYGTSVDELKRVNGLTSDSIRTGQSLRLP
ncbi:MAG: LysM peptidoglycan-binding domain-containing protein [Verrucomicrobiota bacterium]